MHPQSLPQAPADRNDGLPDDGSIDVNAQAPSGRGRRPVTEYNSPILMVGGDKFLTDDGCAARRPLPGVLPCARCRS